MALALAVAMAAQLALASAFLNDQARPIRDRSVDYSLRILTLSYAAGALDGPVLEKQSGGYEDGVLVIAATARGRTDGRCDLCVRLAAWWA